MTDLAKQTFKLKINKHSTISIYIVLILLQYFNFNIWQQKKYFRIVCQKVFGLHFFLLINFIKMRYKDLDYNNNNNNYNNKITIGSLLHIHGTKEDMIWVVIACSRLLTRDNSTIKRQIRKN